MLRLLRLWRLGGQDLRLLWFALHHGRRPPWLLPAAAALAIYALEPLNFELPLLGIIDDFILLPLLLHWLAKMIPGHIKSEFNAPRAVN